MRRAILGALYRSPGVSIDLYFLPPYSTEEIIRTAIFQFEIVIGDLIMVCFQFPSFHATWSLTVGWRFIACTIFMTGVFWLVPFL